MTEDNMEQAMRAHVQATYKNGNGHHPAEMVGELDDRPPARFTSPAGQEIIDIIEGFGLTYHEAQIIKHVLSWRQNGGIADLHQAAWFLARFIKNQQ